MRYSTLLGKTRKNLPADEVTLNAKLLNQAGYVNKLMAGVYSYLPLGLRVLRRIEALIREEMTAIGGQEVLLPALQPAENWKKTGGWDNIEILFKLNSRTGQEYALGQSHEEIITPLVKQYINSYRDLPLFIFQIQNKYRDELRAKSGILRGREFGMKDMYSFHLNQYDFDRFYQTVRKAYLKVFKQCDLKSKVTEASGGAFSPKISYEFMVLTSAGEDDILYCDQCDYCINTEITEMKAGEVCPKCKQDKLKQARAAEVGNIFDLGNKYTKDFDFFVIGKTGEKVYPLMGCYGIGTTRLMGVVAEKHTDDKGLLWPASLSPFAAHLILIGKEKSTASFAELVYRELVGKGIEVLFDDRKNILAGEKFRDADLIGITYRLLISDETAAKKQIELKKRGQSAMQKINLSKLLNKFFPASEL